MKAACALLVLGLVSAASAYFSDGQHDPKESLLLFVHAGHVVFDAKRTKYVLQFNHCKHYDIKIQHVELMQFQGKEMTVKTIKGGPNTHFVGVELTNGGELANFEFKVWGQWVGNREKIDHEIPFRLDTKWQDCSKLLQDHLNKQNKS